MGYETQTVKVAGRNNIVITLTGPEKDGEVLPTKDELIALFNKANEVEVEPYKETVSNEPLIATLPVKGAIESKKHDDTFDATILNLKNGVKVIYKPTTFKDDEILMSAYSFGGLSVMDQNDPFTLQEINSLVTLGNTVLIIEHNLDVIKMADYIIDMGPEGGDRGGQIVCQGTPEEVSKCKESYTAYYLKEELPKV